MAKKNTTIQMKVWPAACSTPASNSQALAASIDPESR
jgi:hypothetical protein